MTQLHPIIMGSSHRLTRPVLNSLLHCAAAFNMNRQTPLGYSASATLEESLLSTRSVGSELPSAKIYEPVRFYF